MLIPVNGVVAAERVMGMGTNAIGISFAPSKTVCSAKDTWARINGTRVPGQKGIPHAQLFLRFGSRHTHIFVHGSMIPKTLCKPCSADPFLASQPVLIWPALIGMSQAKDPFMGQRGLQWSRTADTRSVLLPSARSIRTLPHREMCPSVAKRSPRDITPHTIIITISLCFITFLAVLRSQLCFCDFFRQCFGISVCLLSLSA